MDWRQDFLGEIEERFLQQLQQQEQRQQQAEQAQLFQLLNAPTATVDPRMMLQEHELRWAYRIKDFIAEHNARAADAANHDSDDAYIIQDLCDFELAQWAVVTSQNQNMAEVLDRIYKLQCFREEHKLKQSTETEGMLEEVMSIITAFLKQQPGFILSVDYMPLMRDNYVFLADFSAFNPAATTVSDQEWKWLVAGFFYMFQAMNSNLLAVRKGVSMVVECMDMGFHNYMPHVEERWCNEIFNYYPMRHKESLWLHTPTVATLCISVLKQFMTGEQRRSITLGCYIEGYDGKIDALFKTPTLEIAQMQLLQRIERFLVERQQAQATYKLPSLPPPNYI